MSGWGDLSDSELFNRLVARLPRPRGETAYRLVQHRDEEATAAAIDEWLGDYE